jgi:hypothetical protein
MQRHLVVGNPLDRQWMANSHFPSTPAQSHGRAPTPIQERMAPKWEYCLCWLSSKYTPDRMDDHSLRWNHALNSFSAFSLDGPESNVLNLLSLFDPSNVLCCLVAHGKVISLQEVSNDNDALHLQRKKPVFLGGHISTVVSKSPIGLLQH